MLIKWFLFHLYTFSCALGKSFIFPYASVSFLEKRDFLIIRRKILEEAVHIYKVH